MPKKRQWIPGVLLVATIVALSSCQAASDNATPSAKASLAASSTPTAEPSAPASASPSDAGEGEVTSVFEIEVGDCFSTDGGQLTSVLVIDCDRPHTYEAFHLFDHEAGPFDAYPGDEVILDYADTECRPPFEPYVGKPYETSIWYIASITPSADTWAEGDREIICTLDQQDQDGVAIEVTGSAEGSAE